MISQTNIFKLIITISSILLLGLGCNKKENTTNTISTTIDPLRYFVEQIVGNKFEVMSLVPAGANPESYDPAPSQMITLDKSEIYFKIGFLGIENTLIDKIKGQSNLNIVDCSKGINIIEDVHSHDKDVESDHYNAHAGGDPHYWSSTNSARIIIKNILDAIVIFDKENKEFYTNNYNNQLAKINDTDSIIRSFLSKSDSKSFVIYHPALSYFAQEYKLQQLSIEHEGKNPSPSQLKNLIDEAKDKKVKAVFMQKEFDIKNAEIIAKQIGAEIYPINLLSYNWHDEMIEIAKAIAGKNE